MHSDKYQSVLCDIFSCRYIIKCKIKRRNKIIYFAKKLWCRNIKTYFKKLFRIWCCNFPYEYAHDEIFWVPYLIPIKSLLTFMPKFFWLFWYQNTYSNISICNLVSGLFLSIYFHYRMVCKTTKEMDTNLLT